MSKLEAWYASQAEYFADRWKETPIRRFAWALAHFARLAKSRDYQDILEEQRIYGRVRYREMRAKNPLPKKLGRKPGPPRKWKFQHE